MDIVCIICHQPHTQPGGLILGLDPPPKSGPAAVHGLYYKAHVCEQDWEAALLRVEAALEDLGRDVRHSQRKRSQQPVDGSES
mgnify:CR=1 FL=1